MRFTGAKVYTTTIKAATNHGGKAHIMPGDDVDADDDGEDYPDLPPDQLRRLACLDRALERAAEQTRPVTAEQIVAEARAYDLFIAGP
jgi:hypothetical protein